MNPTIKTLRPVVLAILDGWGDAEGKHAEHDTLFKAHTPNLNALSERFNYSRLDASEHAVGLPDGQMGNSEVGHMNIGSGRVVLQDFPRIDQAIGDGSLAKNPKLQAMIAELKETGKACHILGLLSPGGVHAHQDHMAALANIVAGAGVPVWIHAFLDGRDTPPKSAEEYLARFQEMVAHQTDHSNRLKFLRFINAIPMLAVPCPALKRRYSSGDTPLARRALNVFHNFFWGFHDALKPRSSVNFATVSGRFFGMDRDQRWDRVQQAYRAMAEEGGDWAANELQPVATAYSMDTTDEFVPPCVIGGFEKMEDGDAIIMANFRADRVREILTALLDPAFDGFPRRRVVKFSHAIGMVEYSDKLNPFISTLFPPEALHDILGEIVANAGMKQLRIAETEKYAHVTFFFNGGREAPFVGEERILVPSPKVATYDLQPEMSAPELTDKLIAAITQQSFDLIVVNYANADMVGHSGDMAAAVKAVETVDACIGRVWDAVRSVGGALVLSADHGNIEQMFDEDSNQPHTAHTLNRVPFAIYAEGFEKPFQPKDGKLADIAPTLLRLLKLEKPAAMTGGSLIA